MFSMVIAQQAWTWTYSAFLKPSHNYENKILFEKSKTPAFTQLICSWNAQRPAKGFFRFSARVRYAQSGIWSPWYHMYDWGARIQKSYLKKHGLSSYRHVRLEIDIDQKANALQILVEPFDGADIKNLHAMHISLSNMELFQEEAVDTSLKDLPSNSIANIPHFSQMILDHPKKEALCSPTSLSMVLSHLLKKHLDPVSFAGKVYDEGLEVFGSWPFNVAAAYEIVNKKYFIRVQRLHSFRQLHEMLEKKIPVIVSVRGYLPGGAKEYTDGHLLVVRGWNRPFKKVLCLDPAFEDPKKTNVAYDIQPFLRAWEKSKRLAYYLIPKESI